MNSRSSCSRSRAASTDPAGCGWAAASQARTTWISASESRSRARCSAGSSSVPTWPSDRGRRRRKVHVGDVGVDDLLGLEHVGELVEPVVGHLDDADVELEPAVAAGLGMAAGERVEHGGLAAPGKPDDGDLHGRDATGGARLGGERLQRRAARPRRRRAPRPDLLEPLERDDHVAEPPAGGDPAVDDDRPHRGGVPDLVQDGPVRLRQDPERRAWARVDASQWGRNRTGAGTSGSGSGAPGRSTRAFPPRPRASRAPGRSRAPRSSGGHADPCPLRDVASTAPARRRSGTSGPATREPPPRSHPRARPSHPRAPAGRPGAAPTCPTAARARG